MIILKGFLGQTYGGIATIRGYAPIRDIIKCSKPGDFQRSIIDEHKKSLIEFYREGKDVFFPEVILALELTYDFTKDDISTPTADWYSLLFARGKFTSNVDNYEIWVTKARGKTDWSLPASIRIMNEPEEGEELMLRIDGNHRLIAFAEYGRIDKRILDYQIPFCVALLYPEAAKRVRKTLFHNINSKAIPLKNEFLLSAIIKDVESFPDERLEEPDFGASYCYARRTDGQRVLESLPHLKACIIESTPEEHPVPLTFFKDLHDLIATSRISEENRSDQRVRDAMTDLESFLQANIEASKTRCIGVLHAYIYFFLLDKYKYTAYKTWLVENHIYRITKMKGNEIIYIFDAILESISKTIFIAMPFYTTTNKTYQGVKDVIHSLNQEFNFGLELRPLRIDKRKKGRTFEVMQDILTHIEECGLMLADLTFGNANVYYEIGYKMGIENLKGDRCKNLICFHVGIPENYPRPDVKKEVMFDLEHLNIVKAKDHDDMKEKLKEQIRIRYMIDRQQYE